MSAPDSSADTRVAVCALSVRVPGARDVDAFWDMLREGRDGLTRLDPAALDAHGAPASMRRHPGHVPVAGLIPDQDAFDPTPFGFTDAEAALLDPQQRLFLEAAWDALERAGHGSGSDAGAVGVFAGAMQSAYLAHNLADRWDPAGSGTDPLASLETALATQPDYLPMQVAHRLDLTGPAVAVASSCSTSLVAVHLGVQSLLAGESDTVLAGGVSLIVPQGHGYVHVPGSIYARDGVVRPFSAEGTGIVYSQGVGVAVLRRLDDALADGDPILAVVHGSAVGNDGAGKTGFTAPSPGGQARAVAEALAVAGVSPRPVGLLEAHGTATPLGDPVEVAALRRVFGETGPPWCALGSVKGTVGHTNAAAGIVSFAKAVLALHHRTLPASLHAAPENPQLHLEDSPFRVVTAARPWDTPPHAGVSSFGIGGTNAHVVLGPAPERTPDPPPTGPPLLVVSAATAEAARATAQAVAADLADADPTRVAAAARTLAVGRPALRHRVVATAPGALVRATPVEVGGTPRLLLAFPGAGSAVPGMGAGLYRDEPEFTKAFDEIADLLRAPLGADVRDALDPGCPPGRLADPGFGLPALFAVEVALARLLSAWGVRPDGMLGHSLGECSAAAVSGALDLPSAARLVAARAQAASRAARDGAMLVVARDAADLEVPADLDVAAVNAPGTTTLSGPAAAIDAFAGRCRDQRTAATRLGVGALHSRLVEPELPGLRDALHDLTGATPTVALWSTLTAHRVTDLTDPDHWTAQLRGTVRFSETLRATLADGPAVLVEVGPGSTLAGLARRHRRGDGAPDLAGVVPGLDGDDRAAVRQMLGALWAHGVEVEPGVVAAPGRRAVVPGTVFSRRRFWIDPPTTTHADPTVGPDEPLQLPVWEPAPPTDPSPAAPWRVVGTGTLADRVRALLPTADDGDPVGTVVVADDVATSDPAALRHEIARVADAAGSATGTFALITRGAARVAADPAPDPAAAALAVLPRVVAQETPGLRWLTVDLARSSSGSDIEAEAVLAELAALPADGPGVSVARRGTTRWRPATQTWAPASPAPEVSAPGTVLVLGGLGPVGRLLAGHYTEQGHRVVVTSRSGGRADALPAAFEVRRGDVTDASGVGELVAELSTDGPLALVVHAAGVVADTRLDPVRDLADVGTDDQTETHLRVKLGGALALRAAIDALAADRRPRRVLVMSSVATVLGGVGTGAYAAANAAMEALAAHEPSWLSVRWDGWSVGADGVALRDALDAPTGTRALDRLLAAAPGPDTVAVAASDLAPRIAAASTPRKVSDGADRAPAPDGPTGVVAALWGELFGTSVRDDDADFFALGGHSLLGTRMLAALAERTGVELTLRDLLGAPTVRGLATLVEHGAAGSADARRPGVVDAEVLDADGTFPMTRVRHAYWIGRRGGYAGGDVPCHFYLEYDAADLDLDRYEDAWNTVIARHPMLRATATPTGRLRVRDDLPRYRIRVHDLRETGADRRDRRLAALREQVRDRSGPAERWPLIDVRAARLPGDRVRLFLGVDVLVCDAASWWIVESELRAVYEGRALSPPPATGPTTCVAALAARAAGPEGARAAAFWRDRLDVLPGPPPLPRASLPDGPPRFERRSARLGSAEWAGVRRAAARLQITPTALLLTAYTDALAGWTGTRGFSVVLTTFDRPPGLPDVDRVVGDFTSLVLHEVPDDAPGELGARAVATQTRLFDELDHRAYSALDVLAERSTRDGTRFEVPVVFTGALGLGPATGQEAGEDDLEWVGEQVHAASRTPQTWLDHQVLEVGGELRLQWDAPAGLLPAGELDEVVARHAEQLRDLGRAEPRPVTPPDPADVVLPLRRADHDGAPTLLLAHPSGGDVLCYAELARALDPGLAVVGLTDPGLHEDRDGPETIPGIAAELLDAARRAGHTGPWRLGGWSMGGTVAQEMAVQLHEQGERVLCLAMIDANDPTHIRPVPGDAAAAVELAVAVRHLRALEAYLGVDLDVGTDAADALADLHPAARDEAVAARLVTHRLVGPLRPVPTVRRRLAVLARHLRALAGHTPRHLADPDVEVVLVRAVRRSPRNSGIGMGVDDTPPGLGADLGWAAHLAAVPRPVDADAHHYALLHAPALPTVAAAVDAALTAVRSPTPRNP